MTDPFELQRFVDAQAPVYAEVMSELQNGRKRSHWMWFIFPQVAGLGHSAMARRYALASRDEAVAYLAHPILGPRLRNARRSYATSKAAPSSKFSEGRMTSSSARR